MSIYTARSPIAIRNGTDLFFKDDGKYVDFGGAMAGALLKNSLPLAAFTTLKDSSPSVVSSSPRPGTTSLSERERN